MFTNLVTLITNSEWSVICEEGPNPSQIILFSGTSVLGGVFERVILFMA